MNWAFKKAKRKNVVFVVLFVCFEGDVMGRHTHIFVQKIAIQNPDKKQHGKARKTCGEGTEFGRLTNE